MAARHARPTAPTPNPPVPVPAPTRTPATTAAPVYDDDRGGGGFLLALLLAFAGYGLGHAAVWLPFVDAALFPLWACLAFGFAVTYVARMF